MGFSFGCIGKVLRDKEQGCRNFAALARYAAPQLIFPR
jgi:hypothetical protein